MATFEIKEISRNIHHVNYDYKQTAHLLVISDVHYDSVKCDRDLLTKHFQTIKGKEGLVVINGDWFDLMQGKYDPRGSKYDIRPEYNRGDYIDHVIRDSADWLAQWKVPIILGQGNHETNILRRLETNPAERLVERLRMQGVDAWLGGYSGWIVFRSIRKKGNGTSNPEMIATTMHYHHGYGGAAPRSKGIMRADIAQQQHPDADIIIRGHDHNKWHLPVTVRRLNGYYNKEQDSTVHNLQTGSYKKQGDRYAGWETEKGFSITRMGGWYVDLTTTLSAARSYVEPVIHEAY